MGCGAAAGAIAAGVGAVAGIGGSLISGMSAQSAAQTQADAAKHAADQAMAQYQQTRADLAPYRAFGGNAVDTLNALLGFGGPAPSAPATAPPAAAPGGNQLIQISNPQGNGEIGLGDVIQNAIIDANGNVVHTFLPGETPSLTGFGGSNTTTAATLPSLSQSDALAKYGLSGLTFQPTQEFLENTPGYKFDLNQGLQAVQNANAAKGLGISGAALKGAADYATGLANNTLTTQQGIFQSNLANVLNPLEWSANLGQTAATQTGQQGLQATANANALQVGGANALAAGQVGSANALSSGLGNLGSAPLNYLLYNNLLSNGGGSGLPSAGALSGLSNQAALNIQNGGPF